MAQSDWPAGPPLRVAARELYRLLPAIAISAAGVAILLTLVQALVSRPLPAAAQRTAAESAAAASPSLPASAATRDLAPEAAVPTPVPRAASTVLPTQAPPPAQPTARPPSVAAAPDATLELATRGYRKVRAQGRINPPDAQTFYWFLIREPGRAGYFRQGPANVAADGTFDFDLDMQPLSSGTDFVTLAGIPRGTSLAWTAEALRSGTWLPVVEIVPRDGISFLREVPLAV